MNEPFLYMYFAEELHTHIRMFTSEGRLVELFNPIEDIHDNFADSLGDICPQYQSVSEPYLFNINNLITYMLIPIGENFCLIGPIGVCSDCETTHRLSSLILPTELISALQTHESSRLIRVGTSLYNLFSDNPITISPRYKRNRGSADVSDTPLKAATKSLFEHEEYGYNHNPYEAEKREMASIENGNLQLLQESWKEDYRDHLGELSQDSIRKAKYLCIVNIVLSSRAAIRGGLSYELAYSLVDAYCQEIDAIIPDNVLMMETIVRNVQVTFTELVAQQKGASAEQLSEPPLIARARDFIFSRLHGKLTAREVANALSVHPNYLNSLFKKYQGITVHDYILREKVNWARKLLSFSEYSYSEIATYLGFSSQSHLGDTFKRFTGMTLKQYRDSYRGNN